MINNILVNLLEALLRSISWFLVGYYKAKSGGAQAALKSAEKANEIKSKIMYNVDGLRDRTRKLFSRK